MIAYRKPMQSEKNQLTMTNIKNGLQFIEYETIVLLYMPNR